MSKGSGAQLIFIRFFTSVYSIMDSQMGITSKGLRTQLALIRFFTTAFDYDGSDQNSEQRLEDTACNYV